MRESQWTSQHGTQNVKTHNEQNVQHEPHNLKTQTNSGDTENIGHRTQNKDTQVKTTHTAIKMSNTDPTKKQGVKDFQLHSIICQLGVKFNISYKI